MTETTNDGDTAGATQQLDPTSSDPRALMQALLPIARRDYVKAWELLADASTPLERRRAARDRARTIGDDHAVIAAALRAREASLTGDDLHNARHLASELERHSEALARLADISPIGLQSADSLRPESLGCGKRYRDPAKAPKDGASGDGTGKRGRGSSGSKRRDGGTPGGGDGRRSSRPFQDRGPKVDRGQLGTTKHDSQLVDDLDEATRAKLEALRAQLED